MFKFELGTKVKSDVTGFEGVITANSIHLNGCNRCFIQPKVDKDGKLMDGWWFDEPELVEVSEAKIEREETPKNKPGGFHSKDK